jgi:DNA-binding beta-propeller fold protein YncE
MAIPFLRAALYASAILSAFASTALAQGASGLKVVARIAGPDGGWDYASFDPARRRVYVAHGLKVTMIDADSGQVTAAFAPGNFLHAVLPIPNSDLLVTTNSGDSSVRLLDADDGKLIASVPAAKDTDGAAFDPASGLVLAICGDSGVITLVDPKAKAAVGSISVGGALEFGAPDGKGRFYVNVEDKHEVAVIDIAARAVVARYPMPGCEEPTGLAYVAGDRVIAACKNGFAKILAAATGKELASLTIGARPDAVLYDAGRGLAYIPSGATGTLAVIALSGAGDNTVIDTVKTETGARTGAVDPKTGRIYLPTAEYGPPATPGQRPPVKPGTFHVLVLDR